jgi:hypothetical protein
MGRRDDMDVLAMLDVQDVLCQLALPLTRQSRNQATRSMALRVVVVVVVPKSDYDYDYDNDNDDELCDGLFKTSAVRD